MKRYILRISLLALLVVITLVASGFNVNFINANGFLSIGTVDISVGGKAKAAGIYDETWGYELILDNGDIVQIGDNTTEDFKAKVTTIRNLNQNIYFSLGWLGGTFIPLVDNTTVHFDFNDNTHVAIYPVEPSTRLPEGGIEYDITLDKKPAKPTVTLDIDWSGITWQKIYGLDVEYDEAKCIEDFGDLYTDFSINSTHITGTNIVTEEVEVIKYRPEYEVNSYLGTAIKATDKATDYGNDIFYHRVSRTYLYIHRGQMIDALGQTDWIDDIILDEQAKTITFELDSVWLRNAEYPVSQVCGVDPAYTEEMASSQDFGSTVSDGSWTAINIYTDLGVAETVDVVCEMMLENQQKGTENLIGVREYGSSLDRYVNLHEAEPDGGGGGDTHCRMFVQSTYISGTINRIEVYSEDVSDTYFYLLGYWENVSFTEDWTQLNTPSTGGWYEFTADVEASSVCHMVVRNGDGTQGQDIAATVGIRTADSSLERKFLLHESEQDGSSCIDFVVKSNADGDIDYHYGSESGAVVRFMYAGYFGSELDFVELWQQITNDGDGDWDNTDVGQYCDQDGRVCDFLLTHEDWDDPVAIGVRDGDSALDRYIYEHEAEGVNDDGTDHEFTGFSMSALAETDNGYVGVYSDNALEGFYLTGYFLPSGGLTYDISNSPSSENLGTVYNNSTYYAYGSAPSNPVTDGECTFTITNNGDDCDIDMSIDDFTGGTTWNIVATSPSTNEVKVTAYYSGQNPASGLVLANTDAEFYDALSANATLKWDFKLETGTLANEDVQHSATLTVTAVAED